MNARKRKRKGEKEEEEEGEEDEDGECLSLTDRVVAHAESIRQGGEEWTKADIDKLFAMFDVRLKQIERETKEESERIEEEARIAARDGWFRAAARAMAPSLRKGARSFREGEDDEEAKSEGDKEEEDDEVDFGALRCALTDSYALLSNGERWESFSPDLGYGDMPPCGADDCWYGRHRDRVKGWTKSWRMIFGDEVRCDVCHDNQPNIIDEEYDIVEDEVLEFCRWLAKISDSEIDQKSLQ